MICSFYILWLHSLLFYPNLAGDTIVKYASQYAISDSEHSESIAQKESLRPIFHYDAGADGLLELITGVYANGGYHVFYLKSHFNRKGEIGDKETFSSIWGVQSKNLIYWDHPSKEIHLPLSNKWENLRSGSSILRNDGGVTLLYTQGPERTAGQKVEIKMMQCKDLSKWTWESVNVIAEIEQAQGLVFDDWNSPYVFQWEDQFYLIASASREGKMYVPLYKSEDDELLRWKYMGVLLEGNETGTATIEHPTIHPMKGSWMLTFSSGGLDRYCLGELDAIGHEFVVDTTGILDHSTDYGNSVLCEDEVGNIQLIGKISNVNSSNSSARSQETLSLPRSLTLDAEGDLIQRPALELRKLRRNGVSLKKRRIKGGESRFPQTNGDALEIRIKFAEETATVYGFRLRVSDDGRRKVEIRKKGNSLFIIDQEISLKELRSNDGILDIHAFLDKAILEVFINGGKACVSKSISSKASDLGFEVFSEDGSVMIQSLDVWKMKSIR